MIDKDFELNHMPELSETKQSQVSSYSQGGLRIGNEAIYSRESEGNPEVIAPCGWLNCQLLERTAVRPKRISTNIQVSEGLRLAIEVDREQARQDNQRLTMELERLVNKSFEELLTDTAPPDEHEEERIVVREYIKPGHSRYLVFSFPEEYPGGGLCDVMYQAETIEELRDIKNQHQLYLSDTIQVLDMVERRMLSDEEHGLMEC